MRPRSPLLLLGALACATALAPDAARARPTGPRLFCQAYADAPACAGQVVSCTQCHSAAPALNDYGVAVASALTGVYEDTLGAALAAVEPGDADGDGLTNLEEIVLGTAPGDPLSHWTSPPAPEGEPNPRYDVGSYDAAFAFRRVKALYCGRSPTYEEAQAFEAAGDREAALHDALDACLDSAFWRDEGLHRLADKRIRPLGAVGANGVIPLADFEWDYRLFSYALSGERDARDLLLADYHVDEGGQVVEGVIPVDNRNIGQPLEPAYRAGMITTQWFLMIHTMFSELPRTTAAQAYRAYLGQDIARSQGLLPVEGEPVDIDDKGVAAYDCAHCHSTLDPLSYSFAYYGGIEGANTGAFRPNRPSWSPTDVQPSLFEIPLGDPQQEGVTGWADVAARSDAFRRNLVHMFAEHALGRTPTPDDDAELRAIWGALDGEAGFTAAQILHALVDTDAFGVP